jgi:hypothetical protein
MKSRWWMMASMVLVAACDGGGTTSAAGGDGGTAGSGGATGGNATGGDATGGNATGGDATGGSATGGTGGSVGDCSVASPCTTAGEVCVFPQDSCDPNAKGVCTAGVDCDPLPNHGPICLCDGQIFEGDAECLVWGQSRPIANPEVCATGTFPCGTEMCTMNTQFCIVTFEMVGSTGAYECRDIANAESTCMYGIADCGCLNLEDLGCTDPTCCYADGFYQETVTIYLQ